METEFLNMMEKYESMWDGYFGRITVAKQRINMNPPDAPRVHANSYQAGPRQRELEQREVEQMLKAGVAELLLRNEHPLLCSPQRKTEVFNFVSTIAVWML